MSLDQIDGDSAYILFYERTGLDYNRYQPDVSHLTIQNPDADSEFETDYRKNCSIQ